jgi:regulator of sigma E protease
MELVHGAVTIVLFCLILGVLVLAHEFGHFALARLAGVRVHEFGIGFPPRAAILARGRETLYTLNWLPIGGFVKLEGEEGESQDPRSFVRAPLFAREAILLAGVAMNLVLAFLAFFLVALVPQQVVALRIGAVQPDSPAAQAGLQAGDEIASLDGRRYDLFDVIYRPIPRLIADLRARAGQPVVLGVVRPDGSERVVTATLRPPEAIQADRGALGVTGLSLVTLDATIHRSPTDALARAGEQTVDALALTLGGLGQLLSQLVTAPSAPPAASGPIGIAQQIGVVFWEGGWLPTLYLAGILSANLALVNVLPFPPLDGGRILFIAVKAIGGRRISLQAERLTFMVGFMILFAFLLWVSVFDIARLGVGGP